MTLTSFKHFAHGSGGATLWLDPQSEGTSLRAARRSSLHCLPYAHRRLPAITQRPLAPSATASHLAPEQRVTPAELKRLQAALVRAFPRCTDLSADPERGIVGFAPHFSVGQWRSPAEAEAAAKVGGCTAIVPNCCQPAGQRRSATRLGRWSDESRVAGAVLTSIRPACTGAGGQLAASQLHSGSGAAHQPRQLPRAVQDTLGGAAGRPAASSGRCAVCGHSRRRRRATRGAGELLGRASCVLHGNSTSSCHYAALVAGWRHAVVPAEQASVCSSWRSWLQASRYGIGADSINYFAFGANTSPKKLTGVRGITPLESNAGAALLGPWPRCRLGFKLVRSTRSSYKAFNTE